MAKSKKKAAKRGAKKSSAKKRSAKRVVKVKAKSKAKARKVSKPKAKPRAAKPSVAKPKKQNPLVAAISALVGTAEDTTALHTRMSGKNNFED
jgi:hypothetical protein